MAHPEVKVGMRLSFANPSGKRTLLIGEVLAVNGGVARIFDGYRQHYVDTTTARKPRVRPNKRVRRQHAEEMASN